jgi:hypothetical protein
MEWGLFTPIAFLTAYAVHSGAMSAQFGFQMISIFNAASCFGRFAPGYFADRLGRYNVQLFTLLLCMVAAFAFWLPGTVLADGFHPGTDTAIVGLTIIYAIIGGFGSGANISLTPVCVGTMCDTSEYGRYYSTCYCVGKLVYTDRFRTSLTLGCSRLRDLDRNTYCWSHYFSRFGRLHRNSNLDWRQLPAGLHCLLDREGHECRMEVQSHLLERRNCKCSIS